METAGEITICAAVSALAAAAFYSGLTVREYAVSTNKVDKPVRLLLVTDLHGCRYGKNQAVLLSKMAGTKPDALVMSGDIFDDRYSISSTIDFLKGIRGKYQSYYVTGNHEAYTGNLDKIKRIIKSYGVRVLAGETTELTANGQTIKICGADDPKGGENRFKKQLHSALRGNGGSKYTVLLAHRPERIEEYAKYNCDLVLSGHAHGGQWRIPYVLNGVYSPNQGIFPKRAGGLYREGKTVMIVSRGLARESTPMIPRIFNPPEIAVIDIVPEPSTE